MTDVNMTFWEKVKTPPQWALRPIAAGRLRGKTDINPQWRIQALTEHYGPCGTGWKYEIVRVWSDEIGDEVVAHAIINLYVRNVEDPQCDDGWSAPIPGIGGNKLLTQEKQGAHISDEGYKMAVTDAISVACKALGLGADIYAGAWDGSKYTKDTSETFSEPTASKDSRDVKRPAARTSDNQMDAKRKAFFANIKKLGYEADYAKEVVKEAYELESFNDATVDQLRAAYLKMKEMNS